MFSSLLSEISTFPWCAILLYYKFQKASMEVLKKECELSSFLHCRGFCSVDNPQILHVREHISKRPKVSKHNHITDYETFTGNQLITVLNLQSACGWLIQAIAIYFLFCSVFSKCIFSISQTRALVICISAEVFLTLFPSNSVYASSPGALKTEESSLLPSNSSVVPRKLPFRS